METAPETVEPSDSSFECKEQALAYIAGFVASKHLADHPWLGTKTHLIPVTTQVSYPWITQISRGGLVMPSDAFMVIINEIDRIWQEHHGGTIQKNNVMKAMYEKAKVAFPVMPAKVMETFIRTRTHIRIKSLNHNLHVKEKAARARNSKKVHDFSR